MWKIMGYLSLLPSFVAGTIMQYAGGSECTKQVCHSVGLERIRRPRDGREGINDGSLLGDKNQILVGGARGVGGTSTRT